MYRMIFLSFRFKDCLFSFYHDVTLLISLLSRIDVYRKLIVRLNKTGNIRIT